MFLLLTFTSYTRQVTLLNWLQLTSSPSTIGILKERVTTPIDDILHSMADILRIRHFSIYDIVFSESINIKIYLHYSSNEEKWSNFELPNEFQCAISLKFMLFWSNCIQRNKNIWKHTFLQMHFETEVKWALENIFYKLWVTIYNRILNHIYEYLIKTSLFYGRAIHYEVGIFQSSVSFRQRLDQSNHLFDHEITNCKRQQ